MTKPAKDLDWLLIGKHIAARLARKWPCIEWSELMGVAMLGAARANDQYEHKHPGSSRIAWIYTKGYYLAIDDLRVNHGALRGRQGNKPQPKTILGSSFRDADDEPIPFAANECLGVPQEQYVPTGCGEWLRGLTDRERHIFLLQFDEGLGYAEIGAVVGLSASRICQIIAVARKKLKVMRAGEFAAGERSVPTYK